MNIKNIFIAFVLLSSINLFCMDEKVSSEKRLRLEIDFLTLPKREFKDLLEDQISKGYINIIDKDNCPALHYATYSGYEDILDLLIKTKDINLNIQDNNGYTALMYTAMKGDIKTAEILIRAGANINIRNNTGHTALMHAIANNHTDIMELLINGGADLNIQDNNGYTALMWAAAIKGNIKMAELLIRAGANINLRDNANGRFLDYIPEKTSLRIRLEEEIQKQIDFSTLLRPAFLDLVHKEIHKGNVNIIDKNGKSALIWAIESNQEDIVKLLIDNKANLDIQDNKKRRTALHYALKEESYTDDLILSKKIYIVKLLIDNKANLNLQDYKGYTPLMLAAFYDNIEIVELLINAGADLNLQNHSGWTALMRATVLGNTRIAKLLIEKKANLNIQDNSGSTALILAAKLTIHPNQKFKIRGKDSPKIIELLIDHAADTTIKDSGGRTYADYVSVKTEKKIVEHRLKEHKLPYKTIIKYLF